MKLMGRSGRVRGSRRWPQRFNIIADRLVKVYGVPSLGNFADPVEEVFYIVLSARTTDAQYRRTHAALRKKFRSLQALAAAPVDEIVPCIVGGDGHDVPMATADESVAPRELSDQHRASPASCFNTRTVRVECLRVTFAGTTARPHSKGSSRLTTPTPQSLPA